MQLIMKAILILYNADRVFLAWTAGHANFKNLEIFL